MIQKITVLFGRKFLFGLIFGILIDYNGETALVKPKRRIILICWVFNIFLTHSPIGHTLTSQK
jgi:hypothetical protein